MQVLNLVELHTVVDALNVQSLSATEDARAAADQLPRKETRLYMAAWLSHRLRGYVDAWLQTGRDPDGREFPVKRELFGRTYRTVLQYLEQYPPVVGVSTTAGITILFGDPKGHPVGPDKLYQAAEAEAARLFVGLMINEQRHCLCKCPYRECGRYFLLRKPRQVYQGGAFCCRRHQMIARAKVLTRSRRLWVTEELIDAAARQLWHWRAGQDWATDKKQKHRLANALSKQVSQKPNLRTLRPGVKVNWVTRYRQRIEQQRRQIERSEETAKWK